MNSIRTHQIYGTVNAARRPRSMKPAHGFTLFELALALAVTGILATISIRNRLSEIDGEMVAKAAKDLQLIGEAGQAYITANSGTTGSLTTMGTNTTTVTVAQLQAVTSCGTGPCLTSTVTFTPPGSAAANSYVLRINRSGTGPNYSYTSAVITSKPWVSGGVTRLDLAGAVARKLGGVGILSYTTTGMDQSGSAGTGAPVITSATFPEITSIGQVGYMVTGGGTTNVLDSIYLRLDGTKAMTGDLQMGGKNVTGANGVNATTVAATGSVSAGSVTTSGAVNAGSIAATGAVTADSVTSTNAVTAGSATINGPLNANGTVTVAAGSDIVLNSLTGSNKNMSARTARAVPMGQQLYSLSAASPTTSVPYPTCASGGTPQIQLTNNVAVGGAYTGMWGLQVQTTGGATSWTLTLWRNGMAAPQSPDVVNGVAVTYCFY